MPVQPAARGRGGEARPHGGRPPRPGGRPGRGRVAPWPTPSGAAGPACPTPNRPIGSFLFIGPTGVGKTELARALAEFLFDDARAMVRIDMSEYMERHSVSRLVGAPPGYVGYEEGGQLTEAVRRRPYAVVLLDELEKAHPDVFNIAAPGAGGRPADRRPGPHGRLHQHGADHDVEPPRRADRATSSPSSSTASTRSCASTPLTEADLSRIVSIQLGRLRSRLAERRLSLEVTAGGRGGAGPRPGFDPDFGARPLRRVIQRQVEDPLALALLEGRYPEGSTVDRGREGRRRRPGVSAPAPAVRRCVRAAPSSPAIGGRRSGRLDQGRRRWSWRS